jgi:hypothetical protein
MKLFICIAILLIPFKSLFASHIFHLDKRKGVCEWKLYNVKKDKDRTYFKTEKCPNQIVWLKDKSFYYSIGSKVYWANQWVKTPTPVTSIKTARKGHDPSSEVIWGVKGKYNSLYTMVIDPKIKHTRVNRMDSYEYRDQALDADSFTGDPTEQKAAGVIKRWSKTKKKWQTKGIKVVGRYNNRHFDEDLYNNSVLSSRQIVHYNECARENCEELPKTGFWGLSRFESKLNMIDNGIESMGYLELTENRGILFKKNLDETLHPVKPFILCEDNCDKMTEVELPKSFSDNFAMVKKGEHFLVTNENRGSVAGLYNFDSPKPIKKFKGPMIFWHPF